MKKRNQCPFCENQKDYRATKCTVCRRTEWVISKIATKTRRYDKCGCGARKDKRAETCRGCHDKHASVEACNKSPQPRKKYDRRVRCKCGGLRSRLSVQCRKCKLASMHPNWPLMRCKICQTDQPVRNFHKYKTSSQKRRLQCRTCMKMCSRRDRFYRLAIRYGLSETESILIANLKKAICAICQISTENFHMDHNHTTNKFRGLLCPQCNAGIGFLNDNPAVMERAIHYLLNNNVGIISGDQDGFYDTSLRLRRCITIDGISKTKHEWAKYLGITAPALYQRITRGRSLESMVREHNDQ